MSVEVLSYLHFRLQCLVPGLLCWCVSIPFAYSEGWSSVMPFVPTDLPVRSCFCF